MQRTEMKRPVFVIHIRFTATLKLGERGLLLQFVGRLKTWAFFSQTPVRSCSVIPPSLSIMHDSTRPESL